MGRLFILVDKQPVRATYQQWRHSQLTTSVLWQAFGRGSVVTTRFSGVVHTMTGEVYPFITRVDGNYLSVDRSATYGAAYRVHQHYCRRYILGKK